MYQNMPSVSYEFDQACDAGTDVHTKPFAAMVARTMRWVASATESKSNPLLALICKVPQSKIVHTHVISSTGQLAGGKIHDPSKTL